MEIYNILSAVGITWLIVYSSIFNKIKNYIGLGVEDEGFFNELFNCVQCLGFWISLVMTLDIGLAAITSLLLVFLEKLYFRL